jgi:hypothetical protein
MDTEDERLEEEFDETEVKKSSNERKWRVAFDSDEKVDCK